jgi:glycosyltransferase involved in cell wall biosynthesis
MREMDKKLSILFAPHEIGGQMQLLAEELRRRGHSATAASYNQEWFGHTNDVHLNFDARSGRAGKHLTALSFALFAATQYDIFHFFWGSSLYGAAGWRHLDLPFLRRLGKKIFVHFRGLDVVDLAYFDYLRARTMGLPVTKPALSRSDQVRSVTTWRRYAHRMLVSEPDLFAAVPDSLMVPQAIDLAYWRPTAPRIFRQGDTVRIAHAPSMRRKKGTEFVEEAVAQLKASGYDVELVLIEKVPFDRVKELYESCDIGIDQVLYGWYGKVSLELMALGKPVICYIDDDLKRYRPNLPVVSATCADLVCKLKWLVESAADRQRLGEQGHEYVSRVHDVRRIADDLLSIYNGREQDTYSGTTVRP